VKRVARGLAASMLGFALGAWLAATPAGGQEASGEPSARERLDAIREDLVQLQLEKALAAIEALLAVPLHEEELVEAWILRAQAHVAFGDLEGAEADFREILRRRPGYRPEASLTPQKAMQRFEQVQSGIVGWIRLERDPADARLSVGGQPVTVGSDGRLPLLAGEYRIFAEREGFDPREEIVAVQPGKETPLKLQLTPNARSVVLSVEPAGVEVLLDGVAVGRAEPSGPRQTGELVLENLPLGQHRFELRKACFRTEHLTDMLTVDLLDRAPKRYETVYMQPARAMLGLDGGPGGAEVLVDGRLVGRTPLEPFEVCPGSREVEVRHRGRTMWRTETSLAESSSSRLQVEPRPNIALLGASEWPSELAALAAAFNTTSRGTAAPADPSAAVGWREVELPQNTDLALAVVRAEREGARDRWFVYSPILRRVAPLESAPPAPERPSWTTTVWGLRLADSEFGGPALVVQVDAGGPAGGVGIRAGDRVLAVAGVETRSTKDVQEGLARAATAGGSVEIQWTSGAGDTHKATVQGATSPRLDAGAGDVLRSSVRAAWSLLDSTAAEPGLATAALANLALLFSSSGHSQLAVDTWRRVGWGERQGIGDGTVQYFVGRELERLGREEAAVEAYRRAAASQATALTDDGPRVAPAALDRLADLGVAVD
jgi:tetratricopeptide (TPR) repeat protein